MLLLLSIFVLVSVSHENETFEKALHAKINDSFNRSEAIIPGDNSPDKIAVLNETMSIMKRVKRMVYTTTRAQGKPVNGHKPKKAGNIRRMIRPLMTKKPVIYLTAPTRYTLKPKTTTEDTTPDDDNPQSSANEDTLTKLRRLELELNRVRKLVKNDTRAIKDRININKVIENDNTKKATKKEKKLETDNNFRMQKESFKKVSASEYNTEKNENNNIRLENKKHVDNRNYDVSQYEDIPVKRNLHKNKAVGGNKKYEKENHYNKDDIKMKLATKTGFIYTEESKNRHRNDNANFNITLFNAIKNSTNIFPDFPFHNIPRKILDNKPKITQTRVSSTTTKRAKRKRTTIHKMKQFALLQNKQLNARRQAFETGIVDPNAPAPDYSEYYGNLEIEDDWGQIDPKKMFAEIITQAPRTKKSTTRRQTTKPTRRSTTTKVFTTSPKATFFPNTNYWPDIMQKRVQRRLINPLGPEYGTFDDNVYEEGQNAFLVPPRKGLVLDSIENYDRELRKRYNIKSYTDMDYLTATPKSFTALRERRRRLHDKIDRHFARHVDTRRHFTDDDMLNDPILQDIDRALEFK